MSVDKDLAQFSDADAFADWLDANHVDHPGIRMKIAKSGSPVGTVSYQDAVDVALSYGWVDSLKRSLDKHFYIQVFTPRRRRSVWSRLNVDRANALIAAGTMHPSGQAEVDAAKADGRWDRAYEGLRGSTPSPDFLAALEKNVPAKEFYRTLDSVNRYALYYRIQSARKPETRDRRIAVFVEMLARGETFH